jgi:hypothetical protein
MNEGLPDGIESGEHKQSRDAQRGCIWFAIYTMLIGVVGMVFGWLISM